jgi:HemY protein
MARSLWVLLVLVALVAAAIWFADQPGEVSLEWRGWRVDTSVAVLAFVVAVIAIAVALVYRGWLFLRRMPRAVARARRESRRRRGYLALTRGLVAVAAGDAGEARRQVRQAEGLLDDPPLTMLLSAQASQLAGDARAAQRFFNAMLMRPETEFLGLRGLLTDAMKRGDHRKGLELARRAFRLRPDSEWVANALLDLQVREGAWSQARGTLEHLRQRPEANDAEAGQRIAALEVAAGFQAVATGRSGEARRHFQRALDRDTAFAPAVNAMARLHLDAGKPSRAQSVIEEGWRGAPNPAFVDLYFVAAQSSDALARMRAAQRLARLNSDHEESRVAVARAALDARLWGEARKALEALVDAHPSARAFRMMAELEEAEHGDLVAAREWLRRASFADPDPAWVCGACGTATVDWAARCAHCGGFATLRWRVPHHVSSLKARSDEPVALPAGESEA